MVKVAFIVEGKVEKKLIDWLDEQKWFEQFNIEKIGPTIDAKGGGNLCPQNMSTFIEQVDTFEPDKIFILTDLECDPCIAQTKTRLGTCDKCIIVIARKAIEAWFLAEDEVIKRISNNQLTHFENPETTDGMPYDELKGIAVKYTGRGLGSKVLSANKILKSLNFNIDSASQHPYCQSAKYFIHKLSEISQ